jgi:hypothetical protein
MTEPQHDGRLPGLTVQRTISYWHMLIDVAWPFGWTVAVRDNRTALIDATGQTAGHLGDEIILGGGSIATTDADVTSSCTGQDSVFVASVLSRP